VKDNGHISVYRHDWRIRELEESLVVLAKILGSYGDAADVR